MNNKAILIQVMAWCWTGDKPLPEPILAEFTDAYIRHYGEMSWVEIEYEHKTQAMYEHKYQAEVKFNGRMPDSCVKIVRFQFGPKEQLMIKGTFICQDINPTG